MRKKLVVGNWKLNGTRSSVLDLSSALMQGLGDVTADVAVCPSFVHIAEVAQQADESMLGVGSQDCAVQAQGAFTGAVAAEMLAEYGCTYSIVGHSERRSLFGDTDQVVADKFAAAQRAGLTPILCLGELLEEREAGDTESVIARQLDAVVSQSGIQAFADAVIAYEPVWAIGTGKTASPEQAQAVHAFIRQRLASSDQDIAVGVRILYGGSVKGANAAELFSQPDIDGGLIGGAALDPTEFLTICRAAGE